MKVKYSASARIDVLIAYDQLEAHQHAKDLCNRVTEHLGPGCELNVTAWNFRLLGVTELMCATAKNAARAAMIIIAADGHDDLPSSMKTWIGMVVAAREAAVGLIVAQLHGIRREDKEVAPAFLYLKQLADASALDFLAQVVEPEDDVDLDWNTELQERTHKRTTLLDGILPRG